MKKIMIMMMLFAPMSIFAQKFGHVDTQSIISTLPEISKVDGEIKALAQEKDNQIQAMAQEFQRKVEEYQKNLSTMNQTKKDEVEKELGDMQQKIQQANQDAQQELAQVQREKYEPIQNKIRTAIENVGKAGGYIYIFETGVALYTGPDSKDVTADVKAELSKMK
ncbi:MAG: OmpH family outer membrane protein [Prevotella sp.]|nr:OmpH family outer membrane protein [Prevotella sp.]